MPIRSFHQKKGSSFDLTDLSVSEQIPDRKVHQQPIQYVAYLVIVDHIFVAVQLFKIWDLRGVFGLFIANVLRVSAASCSYWDRDLEAAAKGNGH